MKSLDWHITNQWTGFWANSIVGDGQGSNAESMGPKEVDMIEQLNYSG